MAVCYVIANHDKREYLSPEVFRGWLKHPEYWDGYASAVLIALLNGGDCELPFGRWAGHRIEVVPDSIGLYDSIVHGDHSMLPYFDISFWVRDALRRCERKQDLDTTGNGNPLDTMEV